MCAPLSLIPHVTHSPHVVWGHGGRRLAPRLRRLRDPTMRRMEVGLVLQAVTAHGEGGVMVGERGGRSPRPSGGLSHPITTLYPLASLRCITPLLLLPWGGLGSRRQCRPRLQRVPSPPRGGEERALRSLIPFICLVVWV